LQPSGLSVELLVSQYVGLSKAWKLPFQMPLVYQSRGFIACAPDFNPQVSGGKITSIYPTVSRRHHLETRFKIDHPLYPHVGLKNGGEQQVLADADAQCPVPASGSTFESPGC
jgi:hypothetical protein